MNPTEFKNIWLNNDLETWSEFPNEQIEKSNLNDLTKEVLKIGFPNSAAPFLDFGLISFDNIFTNIHDYYSDSDLDINTKNYWIIGFENSGNLICVDTSKNDQIIIVDHEQDFEVLEVMNKNIIELGKSLLLYRNFIENVNSEFGEDGFFDSLYSLNHVKSLEQEFNKNNINSSFWISEIENLKSEAK
ncbi:hypothetical protein [Flavobacterium sp. U410]